MKKHDVSLRMIWGVYFLGVVVLIILGILSGQKSNFFSVLQGDEKNRINENTVITLIFFVLIFIVFFFATKCFKRGISIKENLSGLTAEIEVLAQENKETVLNGLIGREELFPDKTIRKAFKDFEAELQDLEKSGVNAKISVEKYVNDELIDDAISAHFLNQIAGAMTGLGILGTFVGLSVGLNSFNLGGTSAAIEQEIQPLMEGIKVAFHTSIIGIIYSLGFNVIYRDLLSKIREELNLFLNAFEKHVIPDRDNGGISTSIIYQEKMIALLEKQLTVQDEQRQEYKEIGVTISNKIIDTINTKIVPELNNINVSIGKIANETTEEMNRSMRELLIPEIQKTSVAVEKFAANTQKNQQEELSKIVDSFICEMNNSLGDSFKELGEVIDSTNKWQKEMLTELDQVFAQIKAMGIDLGSVNQSLESSVNNITSFTHKIEQLQDCIATNLMNLNIQNEMSTQAIEKQGENLSQMIMHEQSMNDAMIQFAQHVDAQTKILQDVERGVNEQTQEQLKTMADNCKKICEDLKITCASYITNLSETSAENVEKIQETFNVYDEQIQNHIKGLTSYKNELSGDISTATEKLEAVVQKLSKDMEARTKETFLTFDKELAEIMKHFSGTLMGMEKELTKVPKIIDGVYGDMDEKFDRMQVLLDQYLEYADKLHHNIELKWQQLRAEEMKEEINAE